MDNRTLAPHGMRLGAYDGSQKRRHVLFVTDGSKEWAYTYDTRQEAKDKATRIIAERNERGYE